MQGMPSDETIFKFFSRGGWGQVEIIWHIGFRAFRKIMCRGCLTPFSTDLVSWLVSSCFLFILFKGIFLRITLWKDFFYFCLHFNIYISRIFKRCGTRSRIALQMTSTVSGIILYTVMILRMPISKKMYFGYLYWPWPCTKAFTSQSSEWLKILIDTKTTCGVNKNKLRYHHHVLGGGGML